MKKLFFIYFLIFAFSSSKAQFILNTTSEIVQEARNSKDIEWIDVDNDNDLDLFIINENVGSSLFINKGSGVFSKSTDTTICKSINFIKGKWGDYDNDGYLDLYQVSYSSWPHSQLIKNNGDGSFKKMENLGSLTTDILESRDLEWVDYDSDGDLDIFVGNVTQNYGQRNALYVNVDGVRFWRNSVGPMIEDNGSVVQWLDVDNDNDLDLSMISGYHLSIYRNDGLQKFEKLLTSPDYSANPLSSMGWTYYNNDELPDLILAKENPASLFINQVDQTFSETSINFGIPDPYARKTIWADYDNDGDNDLLILAYNNVYVFRNDGINIFHQIPLPDFDKTGYFTSASFADYDLDGDLDIYVSNQNYDSGGAVNICLDNQGNTNNWLLVKLKAVHPVHSTDNAKISLFANGKIQRRSRVNYFAKGEKNSLFFHFGLGTTSQVDSIVVQWSADEVQIVKNVSSNQLVEIDEPQPPLPVTPSAFAATVETYRQIHLDWHDESDLESNYVIERTKASENNFVPIATLQRNVDMYIDFGLEPNTTYYYRVLAKNAGGFSAAAVDTVTTIDAPPAPEAPTDFTETHTAYQVKLAWNETSANVTAFVIERSGDDGLTYQQIASIDPDETVFIDKDVSPETRYLYRVAASNDGILSLYSNVVESITGFIYFKEDLKFMKLQPVGLEFLDYDQDGSLDLFYFGQRNDHKKIVYYDFKTNSFDSVANVTVDPLGSVSAVSVGDINSDNSADIFYGFEQKLLTFLSNSQSTREMNFGRRYITSITVSDVDNDGRNEVLTAGDGLVIRDLMDTINYLSNGYLADTLVNEIVVLDSDHDLDSDILAFYSKSDAGSKILVNHNGSFVDEDLEIDHSVTKAVPADYDNDGDIDLFLIDGYGYYYQTYLYKNNGNGDFQFISNLGGGSNAKWLDYDNDGDLDLIVASIASTVNYKVKIETIFYENKGNDIFENSGILDVEGTNEALLAVADYDNDGDVDLAISHVDQKDSLSYLKVFKNYVVEKTGKRNYSPTIPSNLKSSVNFNKVVLTWDESSDIETPKMGLTYNVVIRKKDSQEYIVSPLSESNGFRIVNHRGNAGSSTSYTISCLPDGDYTWSVQAIDPSNSSSGFAIFQDFTVSGTTPVSPSELSAEVVSNHQVDIRWKDNATNETAYLIERKMTDDNPYYTPEFFLVDSLDFDETSYSDFGLNSYTDYTYRVTAYNCSSSAASQVVAVKTFPDHFISDPAFLLDNVAGNSVCFGDYNNDGDLDILINYSKEGSYESHTSIFENVNGSSFKKNVDFLSYNKISWVDLNADGFLDIFMLDEDWPEVTSKIYRNRKDGTFQALEKPSVALDGIGTYTPAWADYDNDGDPDGLLFGTRDLWDDENSIKILENVGNDSLVLLDFPFNGIIKGQNPWGDFNKDGYLDIVATEVNGNDKELVVYQNDGEKGFVKADIGDLPGLNVDYLNNVGELVWGDYNGDGYLDILMVGQHGNSTAEGTIVVYKNNHGKNFTPVNVDDKQYVEKITAKWGDFDNDGDLDILVYGGARTSNRYYDKTRLYENKGNDIFMELPYNYFDDYSWEGTLDIADYDNDGDLDILHLGEATYTHPRIKAYKNTFAEFWNLKNQPPAPPEGLKEEVFGDYIQLSWDKATDDFSSSLSYSVILTSAGDTIVAPNALANGFRTIVGMGNAGLNTFFILKELKKGDYQWAVQSIDNTYKGSTFSEYHTFHLSSNISRTVTSVEDRQIPAIDVYPNPAKNYLIVQLPEKIKKGELEFTSIEGKVIKTIDLSGQEGKIEVDISKFDRGVVFAAVRSGAFSYIKKVVFE